MQNFFWKKLGGVALVFILVTTAIFFYHELQDKHIVFPKRSHGVFGLEPRTYYDGEKEGLWWVLPEKCESVEYQVQEKGYVPDSGKLWGGQGASCTWNGSGYVCDAPLHPAMNHNGPWLIQASAYECEDEDYFVSGVAEVLLASRSIENRTYQSHRYGMQIEYPSTWLVYGSEDETPNPDLLEARYFVPDYDSRKSFEEQDAFSLSIWDRNAESAYDAPKRYLERIHPSETWERVTVHGYPATKIINSNHSNIVYVFERGNELYVLESEEIYLERILPSLVFMN